MYLLPLLHEDEPLPGKDAWKFFIVVGDKDGDDSIFLDAVEGLGETNASEFVSWLKQLTKLAASGKPWEVLIPEKRRMHFVGEIKLQHDSGKSTTQKVWEFKHGKLRILWCYGGPNKIILFGHVLLKDQRKIDPADVSVVEQQMKEYVLAYEQGQIKIAGGDVYEQTFAKYFPAGKTGSGAHKKGKTSRGKR